MGLFAKKEQINLDAPGEVSISPAVAAEVPDAGEYFLTWIGDMCDPSMLKALRADIDSRRTANGWLAGTSFADTPGLGRKQTPMTFLSSLVGGRDAIALGVWGTSARSGGDYGRLKGTLQGVVHTQGHAAAATWALTARPEAKDMLGLDYLASSLMSSWDQSLEFLRNKDVIKAFRNVRS